MKPYHETEHGVLYHGDCLEILKEFPLESAGLCFTSPPYNMRLRIRNGKYAEREKAEHFSKKYAHFNDALPIEDYYSFHKDVIENLLRISKIVAYNFQIVTGSKEAFFRIIGDFNKEIKDIMVWDKGWGQPAINPNILNSSYELIMILEGNGIMGRSIQNAQFKRGCLSNIIRINSEKGVDTHNAVFPVPLAGNIIANFSKLNSVILDPFAGTGTTAIAAIMSMRRYILIEQEEKYCEIAAKRIETTLDQQEIEL